MVKREHDDGRFREWPFAGAPDAERRDAWQDIGDNLPPALPGGEFAFAASGTCVATVGKKWAWIGTGGGPEARILATTDKGETWNAYGTPIVQGTGGAGVFSVDFRNPTHGVLGGGISRRPGRGQTSPIEGQRESAWELATNAPIPGAIFGLSYIGKPAAVTARAAGTAPSTPSWPRGRAVRHGLPTTETRQLLPDVLNFWAVAFASPDAGWLVGTEGRILKVSF